MCCYNEIRKLYASCVTHRLGFGNFPCHRIPIQKHRTRDVSNDGSGSSLVLYLGKYNTVTKHLQYNILINMGQFYINGYLSKVQ
jgi:hypothetical protein